jgi:urease alpha subunit
LPTSAPAKELTRAEKRKARRAALTRRSRQKRKDNETERQPKLSLALKHLRGSLATNVAYDAGAFNICSKGYIGKRTKNPATAHNLHQLVGPCSKFNFLLVEWDGR